jgi:hypothetical protein
VRELLGATEGILDEASENTQTSIKMPFRTMTGHCMACQPAQQLCSQECIFHLDQTTKLEKCIIKTEVEDIYTGLKTCKLALTKVFLTEALTKVRQGMTLTYS